VPNDQCRILLRSPEGVFLDAVYVSRSRSAEYQAVRGEDLRTRVGEGISGWVVATGRGALVEDAERDPRAGRTEATPVIGESMVAAPILGPRGPVGALVAVSAGRRRYRQEDLRLLMVVANQLGATLAALRPQDRAA
jgi:GAF domain-containing protein